MRFEVLEKDEKGIVFACLPYARPPGRASREAYGFPRRVTGFFGSRGKVEPQSDGSLLWTSADAQIEDDDDNQGAVSVRLQPLPEGVRNCQLRCSSEGVQCPGGIIQPRGAELVVQKVAHGATLHPLFVTVAEVLGIGATSDSTIPAAVIESVIFGSAFGRRPRSAGGDVWRTIDRTAFPGLAWQMLGAADLLGFADLVNAAGRLPPKEAALVLQSRRAFDPRHDRGDDIIEPTFSDDEMRDFLETLSEFALVDLTDAFLAALRHWRRHGSAEYIVERRSWAVRELRATNVTEARQGRLCLPGDGSCFLLVKHLEMRGLSVGDECPPGTALETFIALGSGLKVNEVGPGRVASYWHLCEARGGCVDLTTLPLTDGNVERINRLSDLLAAPVFDRPGSILQNPAMTVDRLKSILPRGEDDRSTQQTVLYLATSGREGKWSGLSSCHAMRALLVAPWLDADAKARLLYWMAKAHIPGPRDTVTFPAFPLPVSSEAARDIIYLPTGAACLARWLEANKIDLYIEGANREVKVLAKIVAKRTTPSLRTKTWHQKAAATWLRWITEAIERVGSAKNPTAKPTPASAAATSS